MNDLNIPKTHEELLQECAPVAYKEIEHFFARGMLVLISKNLNIIEIALLIQADDKNKLNKLIDQGDVVRVHDKHALKWSQNNTELMAVTVVPWLLVQEITP
ncbi:MAG: DUF2288 family protein [Marinicellaceae bacterium]